jgi:hypothetical protein
MEPVVIYGTEQTSDGLLSTSAIAPLATDTLRMCQAYVGGLVDCVRGETPAGPVDVWVADEATPDMPLNLLATIVAGRPIRGTALIANVDEEGRTIGLADDVVEALMLLGEAVERSIAADEDGFARALADVLDIHDQHHDFDDESINDMADDLIAEAEAWLNEQS